jgi:two-component system chemotaxis response regulator CheY
MRILIVDDSKFVRKVLTNILETGEHTVCGEAVTGAEAVAKYSELKPDLVTMDVIIPDMSGVDAVKEIKKLDPSAKIVVISAMGQQPVVAELLREGALDYIVKPFQPARVLESIDKLIDK